MTMKRVLAFIDASNLFFSMGRVFPERKLNYTKIMELVKNEGELIRATVYGAQKDNEAAGFIKYLGHLGFTAKWKSVKTYSDGVHKADWDVGITMDIIRALDRTDTIVLGSADGDMEPVVSFAKEKGVRIVIIGCSISRDLKDVADAYYEITESMLVGVDNDN